MLLGLQPFTSGRDPPDGVHTGAGCHWSVRARAATLQVGDRSVQTVPARDNRRLILPISDHQTVASTTRRIPSSVELLSTRALLPFDGVRPTDSSSTPQYVLVT